jgi:hypothetical protein
VFAAPVWTDGLEADGDAGPTAELDGVLVGLMTDCVMVLTPVTVLVTLPYDGGVPPPDGFTTGGAGDGDGAADVTMADEPAGDDAGAELGIATLVTATLVTADDTGVGRGVAGFWI